MQKILAIGSAVLLLLSVILRIVALKSSDNSLAGLFGTVAVLALTVLASLGLLALWTGSLRARKNAFARELGSNAVMVSGQRTSDIATALGNPALAGASSYLTLGADNEGIHLRMSNGVKQTLPWGEISAVSMGTTFTSISVPSIEFRLISGELLVIAPSRPGAGALFPLRDPNLVRPLAAELEQLRLAAQHNRSS